MSFGFEPTNCHVFDAEGLHWLIASRRTDPPDLITPSNPAGRQARTGMDSQVNAYGI